MASQTQICNLGLSRIGTRSTIASINEQSEEGRACKLHYTPALEATLEAYDWNFARKRKALALASGEESNVWDYVYVQPTDCVAARAIEDTLNPGIREIPFEVASNDALDEGRILTNQEEATLIYTARVTNTLRFSPTFVIAFSWQLGAALAIQLLQKRDLRDDCLKMFAASLATSLTANANAGVPVDPPDPDAILARQ